jgi:DNA-binding protein HU-beta
MPPKVDGAKAMTKAQLAGHLAEKCAVSKAAAKGMLDELAVVAYKEAKKGFTIPGIGKLVLVQRSARKGRNPRTGEEIMIKAKKVLKFRVSKACKDAVIPPKK